MTGIAVWLLTTATLLYCVRLFLLADSQATHIAVAVFGLAVLAVHSAISLYLGDAWKVRFRRLDRENILIGYLERFE